MTDLMKNATRARELEFNLTGQLSHAQAIRLAELWLPEIRFHEEERFHPIDLEQLFKVPVAVLAGLPAAAREAFLITVSGPLGDQHYAPPVVRNGSTVLLHGGDIDQRLDSPPGMDGTEKLIDGVNENTFYSHGKSLTSSIEFFGASDTFSGNTVPQPGDPRRPAHDIVVRAEMRFLLDALRHYLQEDPPVDSLWGWFGVEDEIIRSPVGGGNRSEKLDILRDLAKGHEEGDDAARAAAILRITQRLWTLDQRAWDAVRFYAFLEFYFVYAYNDYPDYGDWPFTNEHEGDVEGCCVVFDRRDLDEAATDATGAKIEQVIAHTLITSVHEEFNDNDELKRLPVEHDLARDDLVVYVAPGSHATYLTPGPHDVLDWEDILTDWPGEVTSGWKEIVVGLTYPLYFPLLLIAAIAEHFVDAEDETTDNGVRTGPTTTTPVGGTSVAHELLVTPLSSMIGKLNLYQAAFEPPENNDLDRCELARRAYYGKWGGHDETADHSSQWEDKTARYFRKFVASGEITGDVIL